jgi:hypothetical protein
VKPLRLLVLVLLAAIIAAGAHAQFTQTYDFRNAPGRQFIRQIGSGVTPDSQASFSIGIEHARRAAFFYRANKAAASASTCSLAVFQVSANDTDYTDASAIQGLLVNDNLTGFCVTDSCNNYDRYIELIATGAGRINWKFGRAVTFWKVAVASNVASSQIDSLRIRAVRQDD